jgi:hypothetical protein
MPGNSVKFTNVEECRFQARNRQTCHLLPAKFLLGLILDPKSSELHYITPQKTMFLIYSICCRYECASLYISDVDHDVIIIGLCFKNTSDLYTIVGNWNANRMDLREKVQGITEWMDLAQDRKQRRALACHKMLGNSWIAKQLHVVSDTGFLFHKFACPLRDVHWLAEQMHSV